MAEGVAAGGKTLTRGVHDNPDKSPAPSADAPKGWTWDRGSGSWKPKVRGEVLWRPGKTPAPAPASAPEPGPEPLPEIPGERDPGPRYMSDEPQPEPDRKLKLAEVPQAMKDDIAGFAGLVGTPILAVLQSIDPYCGGALAQSFEGIVDATLPLICRSQKIVKYFSEDTADWMLWGKLAMALAPVAKAIGEHHILRTVEVVKDPATGVVTVNRRVTGGGGGDPLQPAAQPEYAYPAA